MDIVGHKHDVRKYIGIIEARSAEAKPLLDLYGVSSPGPHPVIAKGTAEASTKRELAWLMTRLSDDIDWVVPLLQVFGGYLQALDVADTGVQVLTFDSDKLNSDATSLRVTARRLRRQTEATDTSTIADLWRAGRTAHFYVLEVLKTAEMLFAASDTILGGESGKREG